MAPSSSPLSTTGRGATGPPNKVKRLSRACNLCRSRKIRCDEQQPSCRNCNIANAPCVTTHPKDAAPAVRKRTRERTDVVPTSGSDVLHADSNASSSAPAALAVCESETPTVLGRNEGERIAQMEQRIHELESIVVSMSGQNSKPASTPECISKSQDTGQLTGIYGDNDADLSVSLDRVEDPTVSVQSGAVPVMATSPAAFNTDYQTNRTKYLGPSSLQVFTQWLELSKTPINTSLSTYFQFGMRYCEEIETPLIPNFPLFPQDILRYVNAYFSHIHPVFPFLNRDIITRWIERFNRYGCPTDCQSAERPALACIYALLAIGKGILHNSSSEESLRDLEASYALLPSLVGQPFLPSAQALLLISIALRSRNKDGAGAQTLGQAIRILQSMGLHTRCAPAQSYEAERVSPHASADIGSCTWWSAYCLEKLCSFETGRPSIIRDEDVDVTAPLCLVGELDVFGASIKLAKIHSRASDQVFCPKLWNKSQSPDRILQTIGELDAELVAWSSALPSSLRLGRDLHYCPPGIIPARTYLSLLYHQCLATIHRAALLMDPKIHRVTVSRYCLNDSYRQRLLSSENICVGAARSSIECLLECLHERGRPILATMTAPLEAVYVLVIYTMRNPSSWTSRSDLALLESACEAIEQIYRSDGQDDRFCKMLQSLGQLASHYRHHVLATSSNRTKSILNVEASTVSGEPVARNGPVINFTTDVAYLQAQTENINSGIGAEKPLQSPLTFDWDTVWPRVYLGNLPSDLDEPGFSQHVLGLPDISDESFDFNFI
ncbi:MAG: hypothetical protein Q9165_001658 [Trypethelium subeluteriae]